MPARNLYLALLIVKVGPAVFTALIIAALIIAGAATAVGGGLVIAAKLDGCSELQIILSHMVPSFMSHIIATLTLAIPQMIIAETALSFLGIGLRPPVVSWGVLLREAQNVRVLATSPWFFLPGVAVIVAVLALNF